MRRVRLPRWFFVAILALGVAYTLLCPRENATDAKLDRALDRLLNDPK